MDLTGGQLKRSPQMDKVMRRPQLSPHSTGVQLPYSGPSSTTNNNHESYSNDFLVPKRDPLYENIEQLTQLLHILDQPVQSISSPEYANYDVISDRKSVPSLAPVTSPALSKNAALSTARELDDLLISLNQFKVQQQTLTGRQATPPPPPNDPDRTRPQRDLSSLLDTLRMDMGSRTQPRGVSRPSVVCAGCGGPIVDNMISAMDSTWHVEHFVCAGCGENLAMHNYYEKEQRPYCEACHQHIFAPKCAYCQQPILDKCVTAMEQIWHPEHFFCNSCQRPLDGSVRFHEHDKLPYCSDCFYTHFGLKCTGCKKPIVGEYMSAIGGYWHTPCFVCQECQQPLLNGSFFELEGVPFCEVHFHSRRGSLCFACQQPVPGRCINAMGRKFHPHHFVCTFCLKELNKGTFKEHADKPYCHECFVKLFG